MKRGEEKKKRKKKKKRILGMDYYGLVWIFGLLYVLVCSISRF